MTRIGIQLATLRSLDEPVPAQLERVGGEGLDGVEFGRHWLVQTPECR